MWIDYIQQAFAVYRCIKASCTFRKNIPPEIENRLALACVNPDIGFPFLRSGNMQVRENGQVCRIAAAGKMVRIIE